MQWGTTLASIELFRTFPQSYFQSPIRCWLLFFVQIPGHRYNRLFAVSNNLLFITRDVSQFGNFISSLLICHVHVRPHTLNSWYGCDPEINNSKLRTGSTEYSDNSHEVLTDQHTSVAYTCSHGDNEMSKCLTCLSFLPINCKLQHCRHNIYQVSINSQP